MRSPSWPREGLILPHRRDASEITWSSESRCAWPFYPDRIADQLGIDVHRLVAFLRLSAYLFRTVFPWLFACHPTASYRRPLRVSAGCRESIWMVADYAGCRRAKRRACSRHPEAGLAPIEGEEMVKARQTGEENRRKTCRRIFSNVPVASSTSQRCRRVTLNSL